ncbi:MAG TPA: dihydroorotate dehydrogenase [Spirochaetota bacterium]|nr:dihydroorotate dehydrogenase [Spirochaetota bacterium]
MKESVRFLNTDLENRSVLASGILGVTVSSLRRMHAEGAGLVTTKSVGPEPRKGHPGPVIFDWGEGLVNAVGLSNPGIDEFLTQYGSSSVDFPVAVSIFGKREDDFESIAAKLEMLSCSFIEINISCPNVLDEYGLPFSFSPEITGRITGSVKETSSRPVIVKLSPNTPRIADVAKSAEASGADALCIMNTVGPGMVIDIHTGVPVLGNRAGGVSGGAVLPVTVRNVHEIFKEISIPIIGTGGISTWEGAVQVMMAGASLYGVGSAVYTRGIGVFREIEQGVQEFIAANRFGSSEEIIGLSHKTRPISFYNRVRSERARFDRAESTGTRCKKQRLDLPEFTVRPVDRTEQTERGTVKTVFFEMHENAKKPVPGQFYMLWIPGLDQKPYSVSYCEKNTLGFSFIKRGGFSERLFSIERGFPVGLLGPLGRGFFEREPDRGKKRYLLAGGGIGTAPLIFAAMKLKKMGKETCIIAGGKDREAVTWIEPLLGTPGIEVICTTEDGSIGKRGMVTEHLPELIDRTKPEFALLCGPELFMQKAIEILTEKGVPGEAGLERMMKCGIGLCGSCSLDPTGDRVCVEGPVFSFSEVGRLGEFGKYRRDSSGSVERL